MRPMKLTFSNSICKKLLHFLMVLMLANCSEKEASNQWDNVNIDVNISKEPIYRQLDQEKETFSIYMGVDSSLKKTSSVAYFSGEKIDFKDSLLSNFNICRAYFFRSDTLSINIGVRDGFSSTGFIIKYKNKKFYTGVYHSTDLVYQGLIKPTHKIIYQKLTLDKPKYILGDSLYGKIEFKSVEINESGVIVKEHFGKGNFRTKVKVFSLR